jgi:electron transport complex protein RnfD
MSVISSPHTHSPASLDKVMLQVVYAIIPAILIHAWSFGWGVITNQIFMIITALLAESVVLYLRRRPVSSTLKDGSALVTAMLLGLSLPPASPLWLLIVGGIAAIVLAKHLYGGLGFNPFNPAMVGYVVVLISFPVEMTTWQSPLSISSEETLSFLSTLIYVVQGSLPVSISIDTLTQATPLDHIKTGISLNQTVSEMRSSGSVFGHVSGHGWEMTNLVVMLGGIWMIYKGIIRWHVPVAMLSTIVVFSSVFYLIDNSRFADPLFHLFSGGAMLGAFFIATDPVTCATSTKGRIIFGVGAGMIVFIIRVWGGYPDGNAFAVLLMNMAAPTIDYYTKPRILGQRGKS